ncbi:LacI family transcriptional regulator [bacterium]|nr:MAG: LacI family transcriptional regulator [bacterium]
MIKMSDIATRAGVSTTTVSFILNNRPEAERISEKTRQKVLQAADEMGYRSNQWARVIRTGNTRMLGLLGGDTALEQVGLMLAGALEASDAQGYTLKILSSDSVGSTAQQIIRRSSELRLMGILALHLSESFLDELHSEARKNGTPVVLMDSSSGNTELARVVSDEDGGIDAGVEHLAKLGHTRIAFIGGEPGVLTARKITFAAAIARHRLVQSDDYIQDGCYGDREMSIGAARTLLSLPTAIRPTAIFCSGDVIALATLQAAHEFQLSVPRELSVIGFANTTVSEYAFPPLTTIDQPFKEIGRTATHVLMDLIRQKEREENPGSAPDSSSASQNQLLVGKDGTNTYVLPTHLIERDSTARSP